MSEVTKDDELNFNLDDYNNKLSQLYIELPGGILVKYSDLTEDFFLISRTKLVRLLEGNDS